MNNRENATEGGPKDHLLLFPPWMDFLQNMVGVLSPNSVSELCFGECPKNRIVHSPDGEPGLNYLCPGFKKFYRHTLPWFDFMAKELAADRAVSNVKNWRFEK